MMREEMLFTTGQFAKMHHLNKRTLHYYDEIGLFSPVKKGDNEYRYYTYMQSLNIFLPCGNWGCPLRKSKTM